MTSGAFATPLLGFRPRLTTEAAAVSYCFHPSFMTMAVQESPAVKVYDLGLEGKRAVRCNMTALFGVAQLGDTRVVTIS